MAVHERYCAKCHGMTETDIVYDWDANPGEPAFVETCLRCEGRSNLLRIGLSPKQKQLNFMGGIQK